MKQIYFDNSTTTRPSVKGVSLMIPFLSERWGAPSAPHKQGQDVVAPMREAYEHLWSLFDADPKDSVIFTSSGAEAVNHIFFSTYTDVTLPTGRNHYLTAATDEAPALMAASRLEKMGCLARTIEVNDKGIVTVDALADVLTPRTALVSLSWANGMTGVIQPVEDIASLCKERGVLLHLEATHVLGKIYFDKGDIDADFVTLNGDNLHAPKGTGALFVKQGVPCSPFIAGGLEQGGRRAGTVNVPGLIALGQAAKEALDSRELICTEVARLRNLFEEKILALYQEAEVLFKQQKRLPHCTTIAFKGVVNEALLYAMNQKGIYGCIGGGSFQQIGLNLRACNINPSVAQTAISFSLSRETTEEEAEEGGVMIANLANQLRIGSQGAFNGN